ncbi:MAG TPA: Hsp20/alpha crystallin family protein [Azospirillum sp.]|nr:Hsp20/alpha crystallin family protein [Azospirillum sp.]
MADRTETMPTETTTSGTRARGTPAVYADRDPFMDLREHMNRLFDSMFFGRIEPFGEPFGWPRLSRAVQMPRVDVSETPEAVTIQAELPGMDEKDVELTLHDGVLTLKGEKKAKKEEKDKGYHLIERSHGTVGRSFRLPDTVDPDKVTAVFDKGVLTITLPKTGEGKPRTRRIAITGAGTA